MQLLIYMRAFTHFVYPTVASNSYTSYGNYMGPYSFRQIQSHIQARAETDSVADMIELYMHFLNSFNDMEKSKEGVVSENSLNSLMALTNGELLTASILACGM